MLRHKSDHPTKNCTMEDCERPLRAKGRCTTHYNQLNPNRHAKKLVACAFCGTEVLKHSGGGRKYGQVCSDECRTWLTTPYCALPADHWARWYGKASNWIAPKPTRQLTDCTWCGAEFMPTRLGATYCGRKCIRKAGKARRRARESEAPGEYTWAQVMRLHMAANKRCSYCDTPTAQPDPDHVVPISRGGRNDIGNILPCCQRCNGDKGDMTLTEWAEYRERHGKPTVRTSFDHKDPRFTHLMLGIATGQSHRITAEALRLAA